MGQVTLELSEYQEMQAHKETLMKANNELAKANETIKRLAEEKQEALNSAAKQREDALKENANVVTIINRDEVTHIEYLSVRARDIYQMFISSLHEAGISLENRRGYSRIDSHARFGANNMEHFIIDRIDRMIREPRTLRTSDSREVRKEETILSKPLKEFQAEMASKIRSEMPEKLELEIESLEKSLKDKETHIKRLQTKVKSLNEELTEVKTYKEQEISSKIAPLIEEIQILEEQIASLKNDLTGNKVNDLLEGITKLALDEPWFGNANLARIRAKINKYQHDILNA